MLLAMAVALSACRDGGGGAATLRALDARSGKVRWTEPLESDSVVAVAAVAGTVVVEEGRCDAEPISVIGLDTATGKQRWQLGGIANGDGGGLGLDDNVVVVRASPQALVGVDVTSGAVRWTVDGPAGDAHGAPVVVDAAGLVLVRTGDTVTALDRATGGERWHSTLLTGGEVVGVSADATTAVVTALGVGSGSAANVIVAYDLADGRQRWQLYVPVWDHLPGPALTKDDVTVYTGGSIRRDESSSSGMVAEDVSTAYDALTGTELWNTHHNGRPHLGPHIGDGNVYESTDDALLALDTRSGRERWRHSTTDPVVVASGNGVVAIMPSDPADASDGEVLAADTGAVRWHGALGGTGATSGDTIFAASGGASGHCGD